MVAGTLGMHYEPNNMTVHVLEIERMLSTVDMTNDEKRDALDTEQKRIVFLDQVADSLKYTGGRLVFDDTFVLVKILQQAFTDQLATTRCKAMNILSDAIPLYGEELDEHLGFLFPQLLENLTHEKTSVKRAVLQTLHNYLKHSDDKNTISCNIIEFGITHESKLLRNEVFLAVPALIRSGFNDDNLKHMFVATLSALPKVENEDSKLPILLCLEHLKDAMKCDFTEFLAQQDPDQVQLYLNTLQNSSLSTKSAWQSGSSKSNTPKRTPIKSPEKQVKISSDINPESREPPKTSSDLLYGFLSNDTLNKIKNKSSWQSQVDGCNEIIKAFFISDVSTIKDGIKFVLDIIDALVEEGNFNVIVPALTVIQRLIMKVGDNIKPHIDHTLHILVKKMNDPKVVLRKLNLNIALLLMQHTSPNDFLQAILPHLHHKNTRVREETVNMIIADLLAFPNNSEINVKRLPSQVAFCLLDSKRRVRHVALECLALVAQRLGSGRLKPLVVAVNELETRGGEGVLAAVQARLSRRTLPIISEEGVVQYGLNISANIHKGSNHPADVSWVVAGSTNYSDERSSQLLRRFSAGKKKLPWGDEENQKPTRPTIGSAPLKPGEPMQQEMSRKRSNTLHDSWTYGDTMAGKATGTVQNCVTQDKLKEQQEHLGNAYPRSESSGSYFEQYKHRMKQIKAAGLKADTTLLQLHIPHSGSGGGLSPRNDIYDASPSISPIPLSPTNHVTPGRRRSIEVQELEWGVPVRPTLARSAGKRRSPSQQNLLSENQDLVGDKLSHTLPKCKSGNLRRLSLDQSPFPSRPTLHRTPSGNLIKRNSDLNDAGIVSTNLSRKISNSTPALSSLEDEPLAGDQPLFTKNTQSPIIKKPMAKQMKQAAIPVADNRSAVKTNGEPSCSETTTVDERDNEKPAPVLARSAQEKLRKKNAERLRQRSNPDLSPSPPVQHSANISKSLDLDFLNRDDKKEGDFPATSIEDKQENCLDSLEGNPHSFAPVVVRHRSHENLRPLVNNKNEIGKDPSSESVKSPTAVVSKEKAARDREIKKLERRREKQEQRMQAEIAAWKESEEQRRLEDEQHKQQQHQQQQQQPPQVKKAPRKIKKKSAPPTTPVKEPTTDSDVNEPFKTSDSNNNQIDSDTLKLMIAGSPTVQRKSKSPVEQPPKSFSEDIDLPLSNPDRALTTALRCCQTGPEEWESKCEGISTLQRLLRHHSDMLREQVHTVVEVVLNEVKNLRSQVTRIALSCLADLFTCVPGEVEGELEAILKIVLPKTADTNQFIRSDAELAMDRLSQNVNPKQAVASIVNIGTTHRNGQLRKCSAKCIADIATLYDKSRIFSLHRDIVTVAGKLATDSQPDCRYHGRRILYCMLNTSDFDSRIQREAPDSMLRPLSDIIESLRQKGLGAPPNGSATQRRSVRNPVPESPGATRKNRTSAKDESRTSRKNKRSAGTNNPGQTIDFELIQRLDSSSWSERYEGLDDFYNLVSMNPAAVTLQVVKVFDKLCPRLSDSNGKVNLYALQTLNRCIPVLSHQLSPAATILVENLKQPLASKNETVFKSAQECMLNLCKFLDKTALIQPLVSAIHSSNTRNKSELIDRLVEVIGVVFQRKPGAISRQVMPLFWKLLSTNATSAAAPVPGRRPLQEVLVKMALVLYDCLGDELLEEGKLKGKECMQRLETLLMDD